MKTWNVRLGATFTKCATLIGLMGLLTGGRASEIEAAYYFPSLGDPSQLDVWMDCGSLTMLHTYQVECSFNLKTWSRPTCGGVCLSPPFTCTALDGTAQIGFPVDIMPPSPSPRVFVDRRFFRLVDLTLAKIN